MSPVSRKPVASAMAIEHTGITAQELSAITRGQRLRLLGAVVVVILLCSACTIEHDHPFRVGSNIWPGYEPLYLARSLGEYDESGIKLIELTNASDVIQALRNGNLEAAALTLDEALTIAQDGYDLQVVAVLDFSRGGDALLARSDIRTLAELKGRRIGVENTAVGAIMLDAALRKAGLSNSDLTTKPITVDEHYATFSNGGVDAVVTFEPVKSRLLATGARQLFDSTAIPDRIVDVLVVSVEAIKDHEDRIKRLLQGYFNALRHMRENPQQAAKVIAQRIAMPPEAIPGLYAGLYQPTVAENRNLLGGAQSRLEAALVRLKTLMFERGMLHRIPDTSAMLNPSWLPVSQ